MPTKLRRENIFIERFLSAYEDLPWANAAIRWLDEEKDVAVEALATRVRRSSTIDSSRWTGELAISSGGRSTTPAQLSLSAYSALPENRLHIRKEIRVRNVRRRIGSLLSDIPGRNITRTRSCWTGRQE